jgi:hypothetical protein
MFPDSVDLHIERHRGRYLVKSDDPFPVQANGPTIASALYAWCLLMVRSVQRREPGRDLAITWEYRGHCRR